MVTVMGVPSLKYILLPILEYLESKEEQPRKEITAVIVAKFQLSEDDKNIRLDRGEKVINNRVGWACHHLKVRGLVESPRRAHFRITQEGLAALSNPTDYDLEQFPFSTSKKGASSSRATTKKVEVTLDDKSPRELLEDSHKQLMGTLAFELLDEVKNVTPEFFEKLVVDVLLAMGYGGFLKGAGKVTKQSHDHGIDGMINEDNLGLSTIYIQAKRWKKNKIREKDVHRFVGSLEGKKASKGVFITTAEFDSKAINFAKNARNFTVVLIDGQKLVELMIDHNVGVSVEAKYNLKKIDSDYFDET